MISVVNLKEKFQAFSDHWSPKITGELNGQHIKLAKIKGEFTMHKHDDEDEMFLVISGLLIMKLEDKELEVRPGEYVIIPKGTLHQPIAPEETQILLFEPVGTVNTGDQINELTKTQLDRI